MLRSGDEEYSERLQDGSLRTADKIKQFAEEYPESLLYLEDVIEIFMTQYKKASATALSKQAQKN